MLTVEEYKKELDKQRWISVKNEMMPKNKDILVFIERNEIIFVAKYFINNWGAHMLQISHTDSTKNLFNEVTHWRELPDKPSPQLK